MGELRESQTGTLAGENEDKSGNELGQGGLQGGGVGGLVFHLSTFRNCSSFQVEETHFCIPLKKFPRAGETFGAHFSAIRVLWVLF